MDNSPVYRCYECGESVCGSRYDSGVRDSKRNELNRNAVFLFSYGFSVVIAQCAGGYFFPERTYGNDGLRYSMVGGADDAELITDPNCAIFLPVQSFCRVTE